MRGEQFIVSNQNERGAFLLIQADQQFQHVPPVFGIEIARRFIREQYRGFHHECSRERDALLLASGELGGIMISPVHQTNALQQMLGPCSGAVGCAAKFHRQHHVFNRC